MRLLLLLTLGIGLAIAYPQVQNVLRQRLRGPRRFALATPGLQVTDAEATAVVKNEAVAEEPTVPAKEDTETRKKGASLLRSRPSPRLRGSGSSRAQIPEENLTAKNENLEEAAPQDSNAKRGSLRIRRPRKKLVVTTTTTTTLAPDTTIAALDTSASETPVEAEIMMTKDETLVKDQQQSIGVALPEKTIPEIEAASPKENAVDETVSKTEQALSETEDPNQKPSKPRFRPIPIKIAQRGSSAPETAKDVQPVKEVVAEETAASEAPASPHRFSSRPRPRIQSRRRGPAENPQPKREGEAQLPEQSPSESAVEPSTDSVRQRSRSNVPSVRRPLTRPTSRRISQPRPQQLDPSVDAQVTELSPQQESEIRSESFGRRSRTG